MKTRNMKMRGQRNNNPLNIKYVPGTHWVGEVHDELLKFDKTFAEFKEMKYGIRAAIKLIRNYIRNGYNTIDRIISRWCPDQTQYTYRKFVGDHVKTVFPSVDRWTVIRRDDKDIIREMVKSMAVMECQYRIDDDEFEEAWELV
ncbi:MAG: hypothetical protein IJU11_07690, partial [Prevotella sp.]|nr:hypothetical protein [Prevotella sp.]